jgi:hypothetical protein
MLGQEPSKGAKQVEIKQRHPGFVVSNEAVVTPGRTARPQEVVISPAIKQLNKDGYIIYNTPEKQDVYVTIQPETAFFDDEGPAMVRMAGGSFVGAGRSAERTAMPIKSEPAHVPMNYSQPADIFSNARRREELEEIDFNEIIIKENTSFEDEIEDSTEFFKPSSGEITDPIMEESMIIVKQEMAKTSAAEVEAAGPMVFVDFTEASEYEVEEVPIEGTTITEIQIEEIPAEMPVMEAPVEETPVMDIIIEETPVTETQIEEIPVETPVMEAPIDETPAMEAPAEETPVMDIIIEETPATEIRIEEIPVETPVMEAPIDETPAMEAPAEEIPVLESPIEETPGAETQMEETSVLEAPVEEPPLTEAPAGLYVDGNAPIDLAEIGVEDAEGHASFVGTLVKEEVAATSVSEPIVEASTMVQPLPMEYRCIPTTEMTEEAEAVCEASAETVTEDPISIEITDEVADIMKLTVPELRMGDELLSELAADWERTIPDDNLEAFDCVFRPMKAQTNEKATPSTVAFKFDSRECVICPNLSVSFRF